jgi:hypothetical protein
MCEFCDGPADAEYWDRVQNLILANGWTVQYVLGTDSRNPAFAYSLYPYSEKAELLRFPDSSTHLFMANSMYRAPGGPPIPALQVYWPTRQPLLAGGR